MDKPTSAAMAAALNPFNINAFDGNEDEVRQALFELQKQFAIHQAKPDSEDRMFSHKMEEMMDDIIEDLVETEEHEHEAQTSSTNSQELSRLSGAELERLIKHEKRQIKTRTKDKKVKTPRSPRSPKSPRKITAVRSQDWESSADKKRDETPASSKPKEKRGRRGSRIKLRSSADDAPAEGFDGSEESSEPPLSPSQSAEMLSSSPNKFKYAAYKGRTQRSLSANSSSAAAAASASASDRTASGELPEPVTVRYAARESLDADIAKIRAKNKERGRKKGASPALSKLMVKGVMGYLPFRTSHLSGLGD